MTIFLHFGIILSYSNDIENKTWKTFINLDIEILLVFKYNKTINGKGKTTKRKNITRNFLESLFLFLTNW